MAARGINKVILVGNLGQPPEVRYTPSGSPITRISIATSESWTDKNTGQTQEKTEWHNVSFFGKLAEIAGEYLHKGSKVYVEGKLTTNKWQDKQGQDRYTTSIRVDSFNGVLQMLSKADSQQQNQPQRYQTQHYQAPQQKYQPQQQSQPQSTPQQQANSSGLDNAFDDDIPF